MAAARFLGHHLCMTAAAKLCNIRGQELLMGRCMRIVTVGTFAGFDGGVHSATFQGFLKGLMTLQANFSLSPGFELEIAGRINPVSQC